MKIYFLQSPKIIGLTILLLFGLITNVKAQSPDQQKDSLLSILQQDIPDTTRVNIYKGLSELLAYEDLTASYNYINQYLNLSEKIDYKKGKRMAYQGMFRYHHLKGSESDSLLKYNQYLEQLAELSNDDEIRFYVASNYGTYYDRVQQKKKALVSFLRALEFTKKYAFAAKYKSIILYNISLVFMDLKEHKKSLRYLQRAYALMTDNNQKGLCLLTLGDVHFMVYENVDTIQIFYDKALVLFEKENNIFGIIQTKHLKAKYAMQQQKFEQALKLLQEAEVLLKQGDFGLLKIANYAFKAKAYQNLNQYEAAIKYGEKAVMVTKQINNFDNMQQTYIPLYESYKALNRYEEAFNTLQEYTTLKDSIDIKQYAEDLKILETKYTNKEKEQENQLLKKQQEIDKTSIRNRNIILIALLGGLILTLGWGFTIIKSQKRKQRYSQELEIKNQKLQELADAKTNFFTNISHEYKTPLTLIINPIRKILSRNRLDETDKFLIKSIERNSLQLLDLTTQVLELTKVEVDKTSYNPVNFNLHKAMGKLYADFESQAVNRKIDLNLSVNNDKHSTLYLDYFKFSTVIKNLISNALKFTPDNGQVSISVTNNPKDIIIKVKDNGRGIHHSDLPHIFDRFYQAKNILTVQEGGTGLGLAICNEFVKTMNGEITVSSEYGNGSQFTVRIPIVRNTEASEVLFESSEKSNDVASIAPKSQNDQFPNILLVEDNLDMQQYIRFTLQNDYNVFVVPNGKFALDFLEEKHDDIHLIISDLMMPKMNGYELLKHLKQIPKYATIPTIMLTALNTKDDKLKALRIGIDDYLTKPFIDEELIARIDNLIQYSDERKSYKTMVSKKSSADTSDTSTTKTKNTVIEPESDLSKSDLEWLENLENLVKKYCSNSNLRIDFIAAEMSVSQTGAFRKIKRLTGLTPKKYIDEIRFQIARELLETQQNYTIKAVAMNVGFRDEKNFSRNFKKRFGKYPSAYLE